MIVRATPADRHNRLRTAQDRGPNKRVRRACIIAASGGPEIDCHIGDGIGQVNFARLTGGKTDDVDRAAAVDK